MQASAFAAYRGSRQPAGQLSSAGEPDSIHVIFVSQRVARFAWREMHLVAATATLVNMNAAPRSVVLFAKALTASDCCTSVSKGGRITIPRVAVERNLPSVADRRHHEVVCRQLRSVISLSCCSNLSITVTSKHMQVVLDVHDSEWTFVIKSWPNGGENKRVYVMEKTGMLHPCCGSSHKKCMHCALSASCRLPCHTLHKCLQNLSLALQRDICGAIRWLSGTSLPSPAGQMASWCALCSFCTLCGFGLSCVCALTTASTPCITSSMPA